MNDPILSIIVPTYGHEKFIAQALDSILMQKTKYSFEVLVGDDASPDNTGEILKQYEKQYPGVFTMYYREQNMKKQGKSNSGDLKRRAKGKYIVTLEGDDFWTDENKIERQISFLETHPEYIAVAHNCVVVGENSLPNGEKYFECKDNEYTLYHYMRGILPGQFTTLMYRNHYRFPLFDASILNKGLSPGDRLLYFALITHGKIYCIQEKMSAYRHITSGGTSHSANTVFNYQRDEHWHYELMKYAKTLNNKEAVRCAEVLYLNLHLGALRERKIKLSDFMSHLPNIDHKFISFIWYIRCKLHNLIELLKTSRVK